MSIVPPRILRPDAGGRRTGVWSRRSADWTFLRILEQYLESVFKWIRYTYDFGDDWRHKIVFEKEEPSYTSRSPRVLKWKGDNFNEDVGGVWGAYDFQEEKNEGQAEEDEYFMEPRHPYNPEIVDEKLRDMDIPIRPEGISGEVIRQERERDSTEFHRLLNELFELYHQEKVAEDRFESFEVVEDQSSDSPMRKMVKEWEEFSDELAGALQQYLPDSSNVAGKAESIAEMMKLSPDFATKEAGEYEQVTLFPDLLADSDRETFPDESLKQENVPDYGEIRIGMYAVRYSTGSRTMEKNLSRLSAKQLKDYCKYIGLPYENGKKKDLTEAYCREIREHPEYLLLPLGKDDLTCLLLMLDRETVQNGVLLTETIAMAIVLGLVECHIKYARTSRTAELKFAADAKELLFGAISAVTDEADGEFVSAPESMTVANAEFPDGEIRAHLPAAEEKTGEAAGAGGDSALPMFDARTNAKLADYYEMTGQRDDVIFALLNAYGFIEIDTLCEFFKELADVEISDKDFERLVYFHLRLPDRIVTFSDFYRTRYAGMKGINIEKAMTIRDICCGEYAYPKLTQEDAAIWKRGFEAVYPEWWEFVDIFLQIAKERVVSKEDADDLITRCFYMVLDGCNVYDLCSEICKAAPPRGLMDYVYLWKCALGVVMTTGLPALKGYSREGFEEMVEEWDEEADLFLDEYLPVFRDDDKKRRIKEDTHLYELGDYDSRVVWEYASPGDFSADDMEEFEPSGELLANEEFRLLGVMRLDIEGKKDEARKLMDQLIEDHRGWSDDLLKYRQILGPITRTIRKVYPNDPCPCGSGKKYKKCCGRKREKRPEKYN